MLCPNCAGTGVKLNPQVFVEWGNPSFKTLPLTTTCECQGVDELDNPNAPIYPTTQNESLKD